MVEERGERLYENGRAWVDEHPIEGQLFVRPTAGADLAGLVPETKQGGLKAVASLEETFRDLNDRITILTVQMPVEARWQAEYLTNSLFEERVQGPTDSMLASMETMVDFLDDLEPILATQTNALLAGITAERIAVFDAVEEERTEILAAIEDERGSIMGKLDAQLLSATTGGSSLVPDCPAGAGSAPETQQPQRLTAPRGTNMSVVWMWFPSERRPKSTPLFFSTRMAF
ncbi:MAG: hypothetical protein JRF48_14280 [Deltaproteobacteria bacterium]|nr:hypothetical protein [Deltaproteobacteria bacterium]